MKNFRYFILACSLFISIASFAQSPITIEGAVLTSFKNIAYWGSKKDTRAGHDSLIKANKIFGEQLKDDAIKYPFTISLEFKALTENGLKIVNSADGLLRFYCWDTKIQDTVQWRSFVLQYKNANKTNAYLNAKGEFSDWIDNGALYTKIDMFNASNETYYLATSEITTSRKYLKQILQVISISNDTLNEHVQLVKEDSSYTGGLLTVYDITQINDKAAKPSIHFDAGSKTIFVPVFNSKLQLTGKYDSYIFNGRYFEKVKS